MKKAKTLVCLATIASLGLSSMSFAQGHDRGNDRNDHNDQRYEHRNDQRYEHRNDRREQRDQHADWRGDRGDRGDRHDNFSYGARGPEWRRGGRVPPEYRNRQYVVSNWRAHHLNAPPRGYQWVQVGGDYVLVAIATGIIAQLLLNHY